jgi:5-oxoprolinase (ATP-hydrolysing) subunit A
MEVRRSIDLNADLGEGFGVWRMTDDDAMLKIVTSASIACGFHAGDPETMAHCFSAAKANGVAVGAHVGFPDLQGFGRREMRLRPDEVERIVAYQLGAAQALARYAGHNISFVKAHGALANLAEGDAHVADAIAAGVAKVDPALTLLAIARSEQVFAGARAGLRVVEEAFADRAYTEEGRLAPRARPGAVIEDIATVVSRVKRMLAEGALPTQGGALLPTQIRSVCVHGDTPQATAMARELRAALEASGFRLAPFAPGC